LACGDGGSKVTVTVERENNDSVTASTSTSPDQVEAVDFEAQQVLPETQARLAQSGASVISPDSDPMELMFMSVRTGFTRGAEVYREIRSAHNAAGRGSSSSFRQGSGVSASGGASNSASSSSSNPAPIVTSDLPGFLPLREDFDVEHENDAENLLADMEFSPDDHVSERELKLQVIRIYYQKLDERNRRKRFVIDRGLVDIKKQQAVRIRYIGNVFLM
jgi:hypothetical protein